MMARGYIMTITLIDNGGEWDHFVEESPYGLLFHRWDYLKLIEKYSGYKLFPYGIYKGGELICLFPAFYRAKSGLRFLYSPPQQSLVYVPYLGFVMSPVYDDLRQHKKEHYMDLVSRGVNKAVGRMNANRIIIASSPRLIDFRHFKWSGYQVEVGYTYIIDLKRSTQEIWNSFSKDCKKSIKDCEKKKLTLKPADDVGRFLQIMRQGLAQKDDTFFHRQDPRYLKEVMARFPENLKMSFLYEEETLVAAAINCEYKNHLLLWMCGKDCSRGDYGEYLNWEFIRQAKERGCESVENWGTEQKQLCVYKSKFNPELMPSYGLVKDDTLSRLASWTYSSLAKQPVISSLLSRVQ
jgi:hypothetical protein